LMNTNHKKIYSINHYNFFDKLVLKKRLEISKIINNSIKNLDVRDVLDIGTTNDQLNPSSNIIIKSIKKFRKYKSISDQKIISNFFSKKLKKSITSNFSQKEINQFSSDVVVTNATIEHVGGRKNQKKMINNIIKLTKKIFIITTPNKFYPVEFHTKIPFIHWLPNLIYRKILSYLGLSFYAKEKNLNLLSKRDVKKMLDHQKIKYEIKFVKLFFLKSNLIIIGKK